MAYINKNKIFFAGISKGISERYTEDVIVEDIVTEEAEGVQIEYDGEMTELPMGKQARFACNDKSMPSDIVIKNNGAGEISNITVTKDKVLEGETFYGLNGLEEGTMPNNGYVDGDFGATLDLNFPELLLNGAYRGSVSIYPQEVTIVPSDNSQEISPAEGCVFGKIKVEKIPPGEVIPDHTESDFTLQLANIALGELGVVYSSTEKVSFEAAPSGNVIDTFVDTNFLPSNIKKDVEIFGVMGEYGGDETGGGSADDRVKYVTYMDRGAELIKYPVIEGDTARDPVAKGYIEKPTKEPTESKVYPFGGWSKTDGGAPDSTALQNVTEDRTVYAAFAESVRTYTVNFYDGDTLVHTEQVAYGGSSSYKYDGTKDGYIYSGWLPEPTNITKDMDCYVQWEELPALATMSWEEIAEISAAGQAENYFAIGDSKPVLISGKVGAYITVDGTYNVYIIGFDHNKDLEGNGITFGTFKSDGVDVAIGTTQSSSTSGKKYPNMNHWFGSNLYSHNYGGWAGCDLRYDILGSTDVAPSGYGSAVSSGRQGYNATETCATNPKADTLMAALPADLRAVMKPMTIYTENSKSPSDVEENVTASIDYLPLLSEFEVFGKRTSANSYEQNKQAQYAYFAEGNAKKKYLHSNKSTAEDWWLRSLAYNTKVGNTIYFCAVNQYNSQAQLAAENVNAVAPIFRV